MKANNVLGLSVLVLILAGGCSQDAGFLGNTTSVVFNVGHFQFSDPAYSGEIFTVQEVRLIANFNNWGNGGFDFTAVWDGAMPLNYNAQNNSFIGSISLDHGYDALFTFVIKASGSNGTSWQGWYDPYYMRDSNGKYLFSPFSDFVDNGVGNGGHNAEYIVP